MLCRARLQFTQAAEQNMGMPAIRRRWTASDVRALMDESRPWPRYELIGGELLVTPAPGNRHQVIVAELLQILGPYVNREGLGVVFTSPADLELKPEHITQPDIFVVPKAKGPPAVVTEGWENVKSLLLAVEVLSPGSIRSDRVEKRDYYMDVGVPEYWIVDYEGRVVERWTPAQETPHLVRDTLVWHPSNAARPLRLDVAQFFEHVQRQMRIAGLR